MWLTLLPEAWQNWLNGILHRHVNPAAFGLNSLGAYELSSLEEEEKILRVWVCVFCVSHVHMCTFL